MSVRDPQLTLVGWAGTTPKLYPGQGPEPVAFTQFRMGQTVRQLDRNTGELTDGPTSWFTVKAFRELAVNVAESVRQGEPVVVHGRLRIEEWLGADDQLVRTPVLIADAIGADLRWGTSRFIRTVRQTSPDSGEDATGEDVTALDSAPADASDTQDIAELPYAVGA